MYYFEIRFLTADKQAIYSFMNKIENKLEIISIDKDDYYICYRLKRSLTELVLTELKENKKIYFLTHYLI